MSSEHCSHAHSHITLNNFEYQLHNLLDDVTCFNVKLRCASQAKNLSTTISSLWLQYEGDKREINKEIQGFLFPRFYSNVIFKEAKKNSSHLKCIILFSHNTTHKRKGFFLSRPFMARITKNFMRFRNVADKCEGTFQLTCVVECNRLRSKKKKEEIPYLLIV